MNNVPGIREDVVTNRQPGYGDLKELRIARSAPEIFANLKVSPLLGIRTA
jgi:hypothetical protein